MKGSCGRCSTHSSGVCSLMWAILICLGSTHHLSRDNVKISDWIRCSHLVIMSLLFLMVFFFGTFCCQAVLKVHLIWRSMGRQPQGLLCCSKKTSRGCLFDGEVSRSTTISISIDSHPHEPSSRGYPWYSYSGLVAESPFGRMKAGWSIGVVAEMSKNVFDHQERKAQDL